MNKKVYEKLIEVAKKQGKYKKGVITYSDLNDECNLNLDYNNIKDRNEISHILGAIARYETKHNRPLLSALVVLKGSVPLKPAYGFFSYADELGVRNKGEKDLELYYRQLKKCWETWK